METSETEAIVFKGVTYDKHRDMIFFGIATLYDMRADVYATRVPYESMGFVTPTRLDWSIESFAKLKDNRGSYVQAANICGLSGIH